MDYQHSQRFPRPPPADPHHHQPPMRPPGAPPGPWYPGQFQYQQSPPPPHSHWPPPSHSDHLPPPPPYAAPPPPPHPNYPGQQQQQQFHNQYAPPPPPRPQVPPQYHPQPPQSYHQDWSNANWGHQQGQDYPGNASAVKEEDWAAKAKAWAATNTGIDTQYSQVQYTPVNRLEEQSHFREQYPQALDPRYPDALHSAFPAPGYQQSPVPAAPPYMPANIHQQESVAMGSGKSSFVADEQYPYKVRDGDFTGGSTGFSHPGSSPLTSSAHLQEVSSSYSSVTGKVETGGQVGKVYKSFPSSIDPSQGMHQMHPPLPDYHRSYSVDRSHYAVNNQAADRSVDLSDQPLEFAPRYNHDQDPVTQSSHIRTETVGTLSGLDPGAASTHSWNSAVPGAGYPHIPPAVPSNQQFDPSTGVHSPVPGHSAPLFGRMPGPMFQPTIPSGGAPYGIGAGSGLNPASFPSDVYGISGVSERPKKASVPNWLKEEIIKNKAVITSSVPDKKEETESFEDESNDKSTAKSDQADSKSVDSSRATEEEDDDEDYVEATRTAAINQEIKRILTEVLLKVTDELFEEIATKVLSENDQQTAGVNEDVPSRTAKPSSAKVLVTGKAKASENQNESGKSISSPPGNALRLVNYGSDGSDDDDDDDGDSDTANQLPRARNFSKDKDTVEDAGKILPNGLTVHHSGVANELNGYRAGERSYDGNVESSYSSKVVPGNIENKDNINGRNIPKSDDSSKHNHNSKVDATISEALESVNTKKSGKVDSRDKETKSKHDKKDKHETRSPSRKDTMKEENGKDQIGRRDEKRKNHEERHARKERMDDRNGSNEKRIEQGDKYGEKGKESDSRKRFSHSDVKEDVKVKERDRKDNGSRREERHKDEKTERSRPKLASESSKHKRQRSSSVSSRGRSSRDDSINIHGNGSSDHSSDDSKRKQHAKRRYLSPSPSRSRKRQDSRSPHSKRSQRRHSPYSSLEAPRGRRSRSRTRSPARRKR